MGRRTCTFGQATLTNRLGSCARSSAVPGTKRMLGEGERLEEDESELVASTTTGARGSSAPSCVLIERRHFTSGELHRI